MDCVIRLVASLLIIGLVYLACQAISFFKPFLTRWDIPWLITACIVNTFLFPIWIVLVVMAVSAAGEVWVYLRKPETS